MEQKFCTICNSPMQYKPAGVNFRTKQPYNAFWGCPNYKMHNIAPKPPEQPTPAKESPTGQKNAAVEMIYELQAIRKLLEDYLPGILANKERNVL